MNPAVKILRILLILAITLGGGTYALTLFKARGLESAAGTTAIMTAETKAAPQNEIHILFVGNSYTFYNNMPAMLLHIAESDADNRTRFVVQSVTRGGIGLKELWEDGNAVNALHASSWDYVVLQEQSFWAMFPESVHTTYHYAFAFNDEIKKTGARTLLFLTWARQPGTHWYNDGKTAFLRSPEYMQRQFDEQTAALSKDTGATVIPIGDYWANTLARLPDFPLYNADGSHPSPAGSYLTALMFYRYFSGHNPDHVTYVPPAVSPEQADFLKSLARW